MKFCDDIPNSNVGFSPRNLPILDVAKFPSFRGVAAKLTGCSRQRRPPVYLRVFANIAALNTPRQARKGLATPLREGNFLQFFALFVIFCTATALAQTPFTDPRDGKEYKTVKIGEQIWLAENLNYNAKGSECYENNPANCAKYGRLYNWETAKKSCPKGWHLPSKSEYETLNEAVGGKEEAGKKLKAERGWRDYKGQSGNGTDEFGFTALPGGFHELLGGCSEGDRTDGYWWSSSPTEEYFAYVQQIGYYSDLASLYGAHRYYYLYSVRCLQDKPQGETNSSKGK